MPVPKKKQSRSKRGSRRSHDSLSPVQSGTCPECGGLKLPHAVCPECGQYKEAQVIDVEEA